MSEVLVTLHTQFGKNFNKIDGSLKAKVYDLMAKLVADTDLTGLNYESIKNAGDRRIRTARVDLNHRAVLFEVNTAGIRQIFLANVLPHDDAYAWAAKATLKVNPASGALELRVIEPAADLTTPAEREGPAKADAADERPFLLPFSVAELVDLGIDGPAAAAAVTVRDENDLLTLAGRLAAWQGTALLDLYTGKSLDDVRSDHQITPVDAETADTDEAIIAAARRPSSQMEFAVMTDDAELRRILDGDFAAWRLFLHPTQRAVAYRPSYNGPFRLTGGAGTGKTVVAIHRAVELARRRPDARVLLCTYNRTLAEQLKEDVLSLAGGEVGAAISVLGVDQLARMVTSRLGGGLVPNPLGDLDDEKVWQDARDAVGVGLEWSSRFFKDEYEHVILANRVTTSDDYLKVARRGRGVRLTRADRIDVWTVVDRYRSIMAANNRTTFQELTVEATDLLRQNSGQMTYDHVVVDEGQDLKPASWLMLRELVAPGPDDLFICADAHQRLYGQRLVLSRLGIETRGRSRKLTLNYRTTAQILHTALGVLHGDRVLDMEGDEESISGYRSVLAGGEPRLVGVRSQSDEVDTIIEAIRAWTSLDTDGSAPASGEIGVLTRRRRDAEQLATRLRGAGLNARFIEQSVHDVDDPIHVMTMHRAKGQEFRRVVVAHATRARLPEPNALKAVPPEDQDDVRARERFLLYVACTRARDELLVTWNGEPSEFLTDVIGRAQEA